MSMPTPRTDAAYAEWQSSWTRTPFGPDFARTLERELVAERQKVRALTAILESICEEWGRNHDANPIGAGQRMETMASKALEKLEDEA